MTRENTGKVFPILLLRGNQNKTKTTDHGPNQCVANGVFKEGRWVSQPKNWLAQTKSVSSIVPLY